VHEGLGRVHAGVEAQVTRAETALFFSSRTPQNLLPYPVRITGQLFPAAVEIDFVELLVFFLDRHVVSC